MQRFLKNSSFGLVRTNPRLTTNIKLIVDSKDKFYLESIDADPLLSKSIYKGYSLSKDGDYSYDIKSFYSQGFSFLPEDISFKVFEKDASLVVKDQYRQQYDFTYACGAYPKSSRLYSEEFAYFAPIWLEKTKIPDYFVIFRIDDAVTVNTANLSGNIDNSIILNNLVENPEFFFSNIIKKAKIIKTFDLTERSSIGSYIRRHLNNENFPKTPLYSSFDKNTETQWRGISYRNGGFSQETNNIYQDYIIQDKTILEADDFITSGFKRNGIIVSNILNLEFLFDDKSVDKYEISRYFGLYVSTEELGKFFIDPKRLYNDRDSEYEQKPNSNDVSIGDPFNLSNQFQENKKGIKIYPEIDNDGNLFGGRLIKFEELQYPRFGYVKDCEDNFYSIDNVNNWITETYISATGPTAEYSIEEDSNFLRIKNTEINWKTFGGFEEPFAYIPCKQTSNTGRPGISFKLKTDISPTDEIRIQFTDWDNQEITDLVDNHTIKPDFSLLPGVNNGILFSPKGTKKQIVKAISNSINSILEGTDEYDIFSSVVDDETVIIFSRIKSENWNKIKISFFSQSIEFPFSISNSYVKPEVVTNYIPSPINLSIPQTGKLLTVNLSGGNTNPNSRIIIEKKFLNEFVDPDDEIYIKTKMGFREIGDPGIYLDEPVLNSKGDIIKFNNIDKYYVINLLNLKNEFIFNTSSKVSLYKRRKNSLGFFSIFPLKDFDFDTHSIEYNRDGDSDFNKLYEWYTGFTGPNGETPVFDYSQLNGDAQLEIDNIIGPTSNFSLIGGFRRLTPRVNVLTDETIDIVNEYDRLKENIIPELALSSKIVPFINKWVYCDESKDVRDNPYRFNVNQAFGYPNFSPSFDEASKNPKFHTHEWYYLQKYPPYMDIEDRIKSFSYFDENLNYPNIPQPDSPGAINTYQQLTGATGNLLSIVEDYFTEYFTRDSVNGLPVYPEFKWSIFDSGNELKAAETLFRGVKVSIKDRTEFSRFNFNKNNKKYIYNEKYNGYKFSCVLIHDEVPSAISVIKNDKFKFVVIVIRSDFDDPLLKYKTEDNQEEIFIDRSMLYTLQNRLKSDSLNELEISDILIPGNIVNWTDDGQYFTVSLGIDENGNLPNLVNDLVLNKDGNYNSLSVTNGSLTYTFNGISNVTSSSFKCQEITGLPISGTITPNIQSGLNVIKSSWWPNTVLFSEPFENNPVYKGGGFNGYSVILDRISFSTIADQINEGNPSIRYINISKKGEVEFETFSIDLIRPDYPIISEYLIPKEIKKGILDIKTTESFIGYNIEASERVTLNPISRNRGEYLPKFRDLIKFVNQDMSHDLHFKNIQILTTLKNPDTSELYYIDKDFAKIKNLYFNKVNIENPNLIISPNTENGQIYPLIDEIAIDFKDFYIFKSNWDVNYYNSYPKKNISNNIVGTREPKENKSFLGSKIMTTPDIIRLENFSNGFIPFDELLENFSISNVVPSIVKREYNDNGIEKLELSVYVDKALKDWFIDDGISEVLSKYINPNFSFGNFGLDDDISKYIKLNLINRYFVKDIRLWEKVWNPDTEEPNPNLLELNLTDSEKIIKGYREIRNFKTEFDDLGGINFKVIYTIPVDKRVSIALSVVLNKK